MPNPNETQQQERPMSIAERARAAWNNLTNRGRPAEGAEPQLASRVANLSTELTGKPLSEQDDDTVRKLIELDGKLGMINEAAEKRQLIENDPEVSQLLKSEDADAIVSYLESHKVVEDNYAENYKRGEVFRHLIQLAKQDGEKMQAEFSLAAEIQALRSNSLEDVMMGKVNLDELFSHSLSQYAQELGYGQYADNMTGQVRYLPNPRLSPMNFMSGSQQQSESYRSQQIEDNAWELAGLIADRIVSGLRDSIKTDEQYINFKEDVKNGYPQARKILAEYGVPEEMIPRLMDQQVLPKLREQVFSSSEVFFRRSSAASEERRREERE